MEWMVGCGRNLDTVGGVQAVTNVTCLVVNPMIEIPPEEFKPLLFVLFW